MQKDGIQIRDHYFSEEQVIISEGRSQRPQDMVEESAPLPTHKYDPGCPFCKGNESMTPPTLYLKGDKKNWRVRAFENKFPLLRKELKYQRKKKKLFDQRSGYGYHEILVETPYHNKQWQNFSRQDYKRVFTAYTDRYRELIRKKGIKYVMLYKNYGQTGGASLIHAHSQILAAPFLPAKIMSDITATTRYAQEHYSCPFCDIVEMEKNSERKIAENKDFIVISPYCARYPFELWVISKKHIADLPDINMNSYTDIIYVMMKKMFKVLGDFPYNIFMHYLPENLEVEFHFHTEIQPRLKREASVEFGYGTKVNIILPERVAQLLRDAK